MQEWLKTELARGLPAFTGSSISGTVVVRQDLVNEMLAEMLSTTSKSSTPASPPANLAVLAKYVKTASVRADNGTIAIDFTIAL